MTPIRATLATFREHIAAHQTETRVGICAIWLCASLAVVTPSLWPWAIFADTVAAAMGLGAWCVVLRRERNSARASVRELETEATRLHLLLTEAQIAPVPFRAVDGPRLRSVPVQRDGEHDHLAADDDWFARLYDDKGELR